MWRGVRRSLSGMSIQIKRLSEDAVIPTRGSPLSAGLDLSSAESTSIPPHGRACVRTDLSIAVPADTYARIAPRSGLALKKGIDTGAGVIDADYRGPVGVVLFNHSDQEFMVEKGDRIAQMILERIVIPEVVEVEELSETERGAGGFGSTGVKRTKVEMEADSATTAQAGGEEVKAGEATSATDAAAAANGV